MAGAGKSEFAELYAQNIKLVRTVIARFRITNGQADDLAQETFLQAFEKISELKDQKAFPAWIARIARNYCLQSFRAKKTAEWDEISAAETFKLGLWIDPESREADLELEGCLELLRELLVSYNKEPRGRVARMFYVDGKSTRDIGEELALPQNTVLSHLRLFRSELKRGLLSLEHEK